jgi:hypothetical protein
LRRRRRRRGRRSARLVPSAMVKRADAKPASGARSLVLPGGEGSESPEGRFGQVYSTPTVGSPYFPKPRF